MNKAELREWLDLINEALDVGIAEQEIKDFLQGNTDI
ncbi:MAG: DNA-binding anti-repressor SinI [Bacillota bacterium]